MGEYGRMSIIISPQQDDGIFSIKAALQSWIEQARPDISTADLATLYATSVAVHRAANLRANVMTQLTFKAKRISTDQALPANDPLLRLIRRGARARMKHSELTLFHWG